MSRDSGDSLLAWQSQRQWGPGHRLLTLRTTLSPTTPQPRRTSSPVSPWDVWGLRRRSRLWSLTSHPKRWGIVFYFLDFYWNMFSPPLPLEPRTSLTGAGASSLEYFILKCLKKYISVSTLSTSIFSSGTIQKVDITCHFLLILIA